MRRHLFGTTLVGALVLVAASASAQEGPVGTVSIEKETWVVGRDAAIGVTGQLGVGCAGTTVEAALYTRGPAAAVNPRDDLIAPVASVVAADGSFRASLPLPQKLPSGLRTAWLAAAGPCLSRPVFFSGTVYLAIVDPVENKGYAGTFVIPAAVLGRTENIGGGRTLGESLGALTALADGTKCATVDLVNGPAIDADGNARIHVGGPDQPAACSREGATISFVNARGQTLFEKRTLLVGVSQPLANVAPEAAPSDGPRAAPEIVDIVGYMPPGPASPVRPWIIWRGVADLTASYELERSATEDNSVREFRLLATVTASERGADGLFSHTETVGERSFARFVCYRVRAVNGREVSAYSAERCSGSPDRDFGPGPFPPAGGSGLAPNRGHSAGTLMGVALLVPVQFSSQASRVVVTASPLPPGGRGVGGEGTALRCDGISGNKLEWH